MCCMFQVILFLHIKIIFKARNSLIGILSMCFPAMFAAKLLRVPVVIETQLRTPDGACAFDDELPVPHALLRRPGRATTEQPLAV